MKLPGVSLIFAALGAVSVSGQFITLEIPHDDHNELHQPSFPSFTSKKYYFVTYFKANFFRAHQYCQFNNMELLTIDTKAEESAFLNLINNKDFEFKTAKEFWTSGTDLGDEGKFFYLTNGKSAGHLNWSENEPNNAKKTDSNETENCMAYTMTENLKFFRLFDRFCSQKFSFVCQASVPKKLSRADNSLKLKQNFF